MSKKENRTDECPACIATLFTLIGMANKYNIPKRDWRKWIAVCLVGAVALAMGFYFLPSHVEPTAEIQTHNVIKKPRGLDEVVFNLIYELKGYPSLQSERTFQKHGTALVLDQKNNPRERNLVVNDLVAIGKPAVEQLTQVLQNKDADIRGWAAYALGQIGDTGVVDALLELLKDEACLVRASAAEALGKIGDLRAVDPLMVMLDDKYARSSAAKALGNLGDAKPVEIFIKVLNDKNQSSSFRSASAEALGRIGDPRGVEPLIATLKDKDVLVRITAVYALGEIGDARAVNPLIATMKREDASIPVEISADAGRVENPIRKAAAKALKKIREQ